MSYLVYNKIKKFHSNQKTSLDMILYITWLMIGYIHVTEPV